MRIFSRKILREFWEKHPDAQNPLQTWYLDVKHTNWEKSSDIKVVYQTASFLKNNRIIFNIKGNTYRIVIVVHYKNGDVFIRFVGTHSEYDRIDANKI